MSPSTSQLPPTPDDEPSAPPGRASRLERHVGGGEPFVWLTGMGLVVGLTMIGALLAIILFKGLEAFWPKRIAQIVLTEEGAARYGGKILLGHMLGVQDKPGSIRMADGLRPTEFKLQTGNKDATGSGFRFIDSSAVAETTFPDGLVRIERMEYGPAIGRMVSLSRDGTRVDASNPGFRSQLAELINEVAARRRAIDEIERSRIGDINEDMQRIRRSQRELDLRGLAASSPEHAELEGRQAQLQGEYEVLAAESRALRALQDRDSVILRLADERERTILAGNVLVVDEPNALGLFGKLRVFGRNMVAFVTEWPREANTEGGIFPALFGTFAMTVILSLAVTPFGVLAAIYLREYARSGPLVRAVRIAINNLAGVPSIVFGVFGLGFFVYGLGGSIDALLFFDREGPVFGTGGILWASLTLALMTVPVVIVSTEEALAAVSRGVREGSLACGASKWQTIQRVVLPAAAPGIITGMILAMARGAGEVAPLMITGVVKLAPTLPIDTSFPFLHLDRKFMHLGFHIYDLGFQSPDSEAARPMVFATTLLLIVLVVTMNLGAIVIRERLRRKYSTGAF